MEWLNYHHLLYFWVVAREGGLVPAGKVLRLSHPTLSAQVHALEDQLGERLFEKAGRKLALTEMGRVVYRYAEEIFTLGREMVDTV
ncbi:MAG TPA: LysR family transcriptional regulator, partial [Myxococcaceae bacterium]|nr:LysR family transcriptional regulator [Myxococcaceae bacterium]